MLAALPDADYARLLPDMEPVPLPLGWTVHSAGQRDTHLYFPTAGIVSQFQELENGSQAGYLLTGNDGAIGVASFLSGESTPNRAVVLSAGHAFRLGAGVLGREFAQVGALPLLLLRYTLGLITQTTLTAVCNRFHSIEQQTCRLILSCLDRLPSNEFAITQELLADVLGVRREGVTDVSGTLLAAGVIGHSRGRITVLDRPRLEARACECYGVVKREYKRLLPARCSAVVRRDAIDFVPRAEHHGDALMQL